MALDRNALIGLTLASSGVIGLWASAFSASICSYPSSARRFESQGNDLKRDRRQGELSGSASLLLMLNIGAFFGIYAFSRVTPYIGRKPTFAVSFVLGHAQHRARLLVS